LLEETLRNLGSGVAIWKLEDPADTSRLRLLLANAAASCWFGADLSAGEGQLLGEIDPRALQERLHDAIARVAATGVGETLGCREGASVEARGRGPARLLPLPERCVALLVESVAVERSAQEDAQRLTSFLDSIVENIPAMVFVKDAEHLRYQLFNRGAERLTGRKREDLLGKSARDIGLPSEQAAFFESKDRQVLAEGFLDVPEEPVQTGTGERRWLHTKKIPIPGPDGRPRYLLGISLDITEAKLAAEALKKAHEDLEHRVAERTADLVQANRELREQAEQRQRAQDALESVEAQLRQAQKMEAVGRLAGGIAHDFNNLLSVIVGCAALLGADGELGSRASQELEEIRRAGERAAELTRQLLAFSRQQVRAPTPLNLNAVIGRMDRMLRRVIGEDVELETIQAADLHTIEADAGQVEQVIMNLVVNARDAMPSGGRLRLETANVLVDTAFARRHVGLHAGPHVMLAVTDTGVGIDGSTQEKIFEPFFTTKEPGKGTGLGLPTVFGIIKQSGGGIFVESRLGEGTTFRIYFPRAEGRPQGPGAEAAGAASGGSETVLLVEDEDQVRMLVSRILRRSGYAVLEASRPHEALELASRTDQHIDLLITDVVMPQLNGRQLAERVRALRPDLSILFMSGYSDHLLERDGVLERGLHFLPKPITPVALTQAVRAILDAPKADVTSS
jgi:PAS domain S-box-containing protein